MPQDPVSKLQRASQRVYDSLYGNTGKGAVVVQSFLLLLITTNVFFVILESDDDFKNVYGDAFRLLDTMFLVTFTIEYALRLATYKNNPAYASKRFALLRTVASPIMLLDLTVILVFFTPFLLVDISMLRILRLLSLAAIFRISGASTAVTVLIKVLRRRAADLALVMAATLILLILSSSAMYYLERDAQPEKFSSIPASMWWGLETVTTIGYGDAVPITPMGKTVGAAVAILGIIIYALPTGIVAAAFAEYRKIEGAKRCPHCGKKLNEKPGSGGYP